MTNLSKSGDVVLVKGSAAKPYELKNTGGVLSCSCPAWRNQSAPIDRRTCKHLKAIRGEAAELTRIGGVKVDLRPSVTTPEPRINEAKLSPAHKAAATLRARREAARNAAAQTSEKAIAPHAQRNIAKGAVGSIAAARHASGAKLRQDEKAKLFGPPVLLAHKYEGQIDPSGWWVSEKLDGVRAYWNGQTFITRQGNEYRAPRWFTLGLPAWPLDGELWIGRKSFSKTISIVKSAGSDAEWKQVRFMVFDAPASDAPFEERMALVERGVAACRWAEAVKQTKVKSAAELKRMLDAVVAEGAEGLMIREPGSRYEVGRSAALLKVKPQSDAEATVVAYEPGKGRHAGRLGGLVLELPNGKRFNLGAGLTDAQRRTPPAIGALVTFRYTELTDDGIPRCAAFVAVRDYE